MPGTLPLVVHKSCTPQDLSFGRERSLQGFLGGLQTESMEKGDAQEKSQNETGQWKKYALQRKDENERERSQDELSNAS